MSFALRSQASLRRAQGLVGCTLQRAPAVRALSEGSEGNSRYPSAVAWLPRLSAAQRAPGSKGPWLGFAAPHTKRLTPWVPRKCATDVASLALSSPTETCAGGWCLVLRVWVNARIPSSAEAAPEARPLGGALRPRLIGECTTSREASLLGGRIGSPALSC